MTVDLPEVHAAAVSTTEAIVARVGTAQWHDPTPCAGWDVRQLLHHIVEGNLWVRPLVTGRTIEEVGDSLSGELLGDDPLTAYQVSGAQATEAFRAPGAMDAPCAVSYGPVPGHVYCGHRFLDVLIHGWDLAAGTGQDTTLPTDLVDACWEVVEPQIDMLIASGAFGSRIEPDSDAGAETRLLALLGRRPA